MTDKRHPHQNPYPQDTYRYQSLDELSWITRLLWYCSGVDKQILLRCPVSDHIKYQGIGGVVLATTVIAFASGSYAFFVVFGPKMSTVMESTTLDTTLLAQSLSFGLIWSLIILNIDRLIVSSTGKDEQDGKISWKDFTSAIPRILMGLIIGVCLSTPLELRILKPEIDAELAKVQMVQVRKFDDETRKIYLDRKHELEKRKQRLEGKIELIDKKIGGKLNDLEQLRNQLYLETAGTGASGTSGCGPACRTLKEQIGLFEVQLKAYKERQNNEIKSIKSDIEAIQAEHKGLETKEAQEHEINVKRAQHLDGILQRIKISHDIGGWVPWIIMLLLLAIELGPIFFKMLMTKSTYDFLKENQHRLILSSSGIQKMQEDIVSDREERVEAIYHLPESVFELEKRRIAAEKSMNETLIEATRYKQLEEIRSKLDSESVVQSMDTDYFEDDPTSGGDHFSS